MATIHLDAGVNPKHATIEVEHQGVVIHSEQIGIPGTDAEGAFFGREVSENSFAIRIPLPNAKRAQAYQRGTEGHNFGPYDFDTRSCVTYCADVLRAGGVGPDELPPGMDTDALTGWLFSKF